MVPVFFDRTIPFPKRWQPLAKVSHCAGLQFSFGASSRGLVSRELLAMDVRVLQKAITFYTAPQ